MRNNSLLWIFAAVFAVAAFIDIMDGYIPQLISSVAITIAFILFAFGNGKSYQKPFRYASYALLSIAVLAFIYRFAQWSERY